MGWAAKKLWLRNGNCFVHLYAKGQSTRGPSFKLPFKELLHKKCFPLIERFLVTEGPAPRTPRQLEIWGTDPKRTVDLYIPPPAMADKEQAYVYHVATRNFFAWVLRRSVVGEHLGQALVGLLYSMHEFRADVKDNVKDMMDYMDEEGYLDLVNQPNHAVGMLYLAEKFQMKDIYIRAFAHCVGMGSKLLTSLEYQKLSSETKNMIPQAREDLDERLYAATDMLNGFLHDELSESHVGIPSEIRAHLERFRNFLISHYTAKFGQYPPRIFGPRQCATMRDDFETLYKLLVDDTHSSSEGMPSTACGGICTLQLVQMFDAKHGYKTLEHFQPRLPEFDQKTSACHRILWRSRLGRLRSEQKLVAHAALVKASNRRHQDAFQNDLVKGYCDFEESSVFSTDKADRQEKVSLVDARKVRWILIYATYQVLRSVTDIPPEVLDAGDAPYHVAISTENVPPWSEPTVDLTSLMRRQTDLAVQSSPLVYWADSAGATGNHGQIEIKPDIDYFALTHDKPTHVERTGSTPTSSASTSNCVARGLSRNSTIRRSMRIFKPTPQEASQSTVPARPVHHEIVVQGYGNGLNYVSLECGPQTAESASWAVRNNSTASKSSSTNSSSQDSSDSGDTVESTIATPTSMISFSNYTLQPEATKPPRSQKRNVVSMLLNPARSNSPTGSNPLKRPVSSMMMMPTSRSSSRSSKQPGANDYSDIYEKLVQEQRDSFFGSGGGPNNGTWDSLQPRRVVEDDWAAMQAFMDGGEGDVQPAWEQYADLGGLTEMR
ncbi:hypothetical protein ACO1O0_001477 [Amphichorda felina]